LTPRRRSGIDHLPMTFPQFEAAVDNLVKSWALDEPDYRVIPREALRAIWEQMREDIVAEAAEWQNERDHAMELLHKHYTRSEKSKSR
jgi:hypothetical protein